MSAAALLGATQVAASPAANASVSCNWGGGNYDSGYGIIKSGTYGLKAGPYSSCNTVGTLVGGVLLYFHCWHYNDYGNLWVYGRIAGTDTMGWTSGANFSSHWTDGTPGC
ncbi:MULTISPECIES: hypothetical protein [unclassified Streptomyces]|uniref:hypothetical protein n=1 Tax=unclassified Streptomyces TaxID=2593676 RepID=UPI0011A1166A|nr:hypothetical protein [Streptomyces sp. CNQ-509]